MIRSKRLEDWKTAFCIFLEVFLVTLNSHPRIITKDIFKVAKAVPLPRRRGVYCQELFITQLNQI